jgi:DNA-binding NtrC family response regulator
MAKTPGLSVLVVDDDPDVIALTTEVLREAGYAVTAFTDPVKALAAFEEEGFSLVLSDLQMPVLGGIDLLRKIKAASPQTPVLLMSAFGTIDMAVQAMKDGAFDFLTKPVELGHLLELVKRAVEFRELKRENHDLRAEVADLRGSRIAPTGSSPAMKKVLELARAVAGTDSTVLISGESGVGKEVLADFLQRHSARARGPYVKVNCGALTGTLLESELFGHEKGAFTGAYERRVGRFEQAHEGTIFLDEIGEMSLEAQTRLLRVLQNRELVRVGGSTVVPLDLRVLCATHKDLKTEVVAGHFREDLYYRVNVFPIPLPPLRERRGDIPALALDLLRLVRTRVGRGPADISQAALDRLAAAPWPGNVRELENALERSVILCARAVLEVEDLPTELLAEPAERAAPADAAPALERARSEAERQQIMAALANCRWDMTRTAKELGISRSTLYVKLNTYGIHR